MSRQSKSGLIKSTSKWKAYTYSLGIFVLSFMTAFLAASVFNTPNNTNAEEGDNTSSASASGYNLSVSATSSVNLNLSVSDNDTMTISEGYVSVITNSPGYKLYISMTGDNTSLTGVKDGLSSTIAATSGTIAAPTSLTRGTWGYAIPSGTAHLVSNNFSSSYSTTTSTTPDSSKKFAVPPVASTNPALLASSTSSTAGDTYPVFYAVQANSDTAPGNYTNNIAFTAVADAGSVDKVTVTPSSSNVNASVTMSVDTTLYTTEGFAEANVYLLTATEYNSISGTNVEALGKTPLTCSRTNLAPLSYSCTFTAPSTQNTYYIYVKAPKYNKVYTTTFKTKDDITTITTMQEMTPVRCANTAVGVSNTLTDTRDNKTYTVKKLADGKCWMTQNLRLTGSRTLKPADSNVSSNWTLPASTEAYDNTAGATAWCDDWESEECYNRAVVLDTGNTSYGAYYSWAAATAGTGTYSTSTDGANAPSSICPKGWKLPTGGDSGEFQALYNQYNSADLMINGDPAFVLSGYRDGGYTYDQGSRGYCWSSTAFDSDNAYDLYLDSSYVNPADGYYKYLGFSVRCIAQ